MGSASSKLKRLKPRRANKTKLQAPPPQPPELVGMDISNPTGVLILVPRPYRDQKGRPIGPSWKDLDRDTLLSAMGDVSAYLAQKQASANVITAGGAVSTVLLGSRKTTHDVDFFTADGAAQVNLDIREAATYANERRSGDLGAAWFNNATQLFMSEERAQALASDAVRQNEIVYDGLNSFGHGLRVYAASWEYALCGKMNRLTEGRGKPYDLNDAVEYLLRYFQKSQTRSLPADTIKQWCARWKHRVTDEVLRRLDEEYHRRVWAAMQCLVQLRQVKMPTTTRVARVQVSRPTMNELVIVLTLQDEQPVFIHICVNGDTKNILEDVWGWVRSHKEVPGATAGAILAASLKGNIQ